MHNIAWFSIRTLIFSAENCQWAQTEHIQNGKCQQSRRVRERPLKALSESILRFRNMAHYIIKYTEWFKPLGYFTTFTLLGSTQEKTKVDQDKGKTPFIHAQFLSHCELNYLHFLLIWPTEAFLYTCTASNAFCNRHVSNHGSPLSVLLQYV